VISSDVGTAIQDLGSANGIFVNGRRSPGITPLHPGDVVQLGGTVWLVRLSAER
jgi:pSer/pThr/pTyr-binding forkhead associated (FHA) protein